MIRFRVLKNKFQLRSFKDLELIENILDASKSETCRFIYTAKMDKIIKDTYIKQFLKSLHHKRFDEVESILSKKEDEFIKNNIEKNIIIQKCNSNDYKNVTKYSEINIDDILSITDTNKREIELKFQKYLNENFNNSFYYDVFVVKNNDFNDDKYDIEIHSIYKYTEFYFHDIIEKNHIVRDIVNVLNKIIEIEVKKNVTKQNLTK